jgi:hypothetical protein
MKVLVLAFGLVSAAAACGSSASKVGAPPTTRSTVAAASTSTPTAVATTTTLPAPLADACSLVTAADVTAGLGAHPSAPGTPTKYEATYVTCDWSATPAGAANSNSIRLAVVEKKSPDQQGFSLPTDLPDAHAVAGLGDKATIYSRAGVFSGLDLIADAGKFTISVSGQYGGSAPAQATLETAFVALARKVFVALGA